MVFLFFQSLAKHSLLVFFFFFFGWLLLWNAFTPATSMAPLVSFHDLGEASNQLL